MASEPSTDAAPQPRKRRRRPRLVTLAALAALVGLVSVYRIMTAPDRLRGIVAQEVARVLDADVTLGGVTFSPWDGLRIADATVMLGSRSPLSNDYFDGKPIPVVAVRDVRVRLALTSLLLGQHTAKLIHIGEVDACVVALPDGKSNLDAFFSRNPQRPPDPNRQPPEIWIDKLRLRVFSTEQSQLKLLHEWGGEVRFEERESDARLSLVAPTADAQATPSIEVTVAGDAVSIACDWIPLNAACEVLRRRTGVLQQLGDTLADCDLSGEVALRELKLADRRVEAATLELHQLTGSVPVEADADDPDRSAPPTARFLKLTDGEARIAFDDDALNATASAKLNGAPTAVTFESQAPTHENWAHGAALTVSIEGIAFPTEPAFTESPRLPSPVRSFFRDYRPHGRMNLSVKAANDAGRWRHVADIEAIDAACTCRHFPYPVTNVNGGFHNVDGTTTFQGLVAERAGARIRVEGQINAPVHWTGFDLLFRGTNIPLDRTLYDALPPEYRQLWDRAAPIGLCDAVVKVSRPDGSREAGPAETHTEVEAHLLMGSLAFGDRRIEDASGLVSIREGVAEVRELRGLYDGAPLTLNGRAVVRPGEESEQWRADISSLPIDEVIALAAAGKDGEPLEVRLTAVGDVWAEQVIRSPDVNEMYAETRLHDGVLQFSDAEAVWRDVVGWVRQTKDETEIQSFTCASDVGSLNVRGVIRRTDEGAKPQNLTIAAQTPALEQFVAQAVPGPWAKIAQSLGLAGAGEFTIVAQGAEAERPAIAEVDLEAASMRADVLPLPLSAISAAMTFTADGFQIREAKARYGQQGEIKLIGRGSLRDDTPRMQLSVFARDVMITDDFVQAMPPGLGSVLSDMTPKGRFNATLDELAISPDDANEWKATGVIEFVNANLDLGLTLAEVNGQIEGECAVARDGGAAVDARFRIAGGQLAERPLRDCEGRLAIAAGSPDVEIAEVSGMFCDGEVRGSGRINPETSEYRAEVSLHNLRLSDFLKREKEGEEADGNERLDGRIFVSGNAHNAATRVGGGELRIRGASILGTPVLSNVAEAGKDTRRRLQSSAELIEVSFDWRGDALDLKRVEIRSGDTHLVGRGEWNMTTDAIRLELLAAPVQLPELPVFKLLEIAREELVQYRVEGTVTKPHVRIEPLHNVMDALREGFGIDVSE